MTTNKSKNILITFGRSMCSLGLARLLKAQGHRISTVDSISYPLCHFSKTVHKNFNLPSPRFNPDQYLSSFLNIVENEKIDLIIPMFEETSVLAKNGHLFPSSCTLFSPSFDLYHTLHNKWLFHCKLQEMGIPTLQAALAQTQSDFSQLSFDGPFALKACYSRASQKVIKVTSHTSHSIQIEANTPFIAQEWMEGKRYCTYSICHQGKIQAHSIYPVGYAIDGKSCLIFEHIDHPECFKWVENFIRQTDYTGQIAFDLIETTDKKIFAFECNPRATNGLFLFDEDDKLDLAFQGLNSSPLFPKEKRRKQIAMGMLLYGWRRSSLPNSSFYRFLKDFFSTKDIIFSFSDLKPTLFQPLIFTSILLNSWKKKLSLPAYFTHDHDWNGSFDEIR